MISKFGRENIYLVLLTPTAAVSAVWAFYNFPLERLDLRLGILTVVTVFFSSLLRIQLPRTKIHVTTSDAAIILSFLLYGGETALILAILESTFTSLSFKYRGGRIRNKTVVINVVNTAVVVFATIMVIRSTFGAVTHIRESGDGTAFVWLLAAMAALLFLFNSILVSLFISAKTADKSVGTVWAEYCLNALVIYMTSAVLAGVTLKAIQQINVMLFGAVGIFFVVVYFTYRRYINDIKSTAAKAERAERERAEEAERHVKDLQHYVGKLEQSRLDLEQSHERLRHAAYHDALTGLPNKQYFVETIKELLKKCRRMTGRPFAVLYLDLNRFKTINDSIGHTRGDKLIREVAARLRSTVGERATVGRFSGDEFAILVNDLKSERDVEQMAREIADALAKPFYLFGRAVYTSACIGITYGDRSYKRAVNVLRDADIAMYRAKETGQKYVVFDQDMHESAVQLMQMETDLRLAIERREFEVYYQPIVSISTLQLAGFEALARWNHPAKGVLPPAQFIGLSESTDMIVPLTLQILEQSCRQVALWNRARDDGSFFVSVNLSGKHFEHPEMVDDVKSIVRSSDLDPRRLKLEITETALMENAEKSIEMLKALKSHGIQISIDDFGTGYSSLNYLHRFPLDTLKIDRSFVNSLDRSNENHEIVRTIICLAKALGLRVVAEGIESIRQLEALRLLECEYGQGYLFSRPLNAQEIESLISQSGYWQSLGGATEILRAPESVDDMQLRLVS